MDVVGLLINFLFFSENFVVDIFVWHEPKQGSCQVRTTCNQPT